MIIVSLPCLRLLIKDLPSYRRSSHSITLKPKTVLIQEVCEPIIVGSPHLRSLKPNDC